MNILLTNDDSHRSPLLGFAVEGLRRFGNVTVVVPAHEQSWKGKSMSRFSSLTVETAHDLIDVLGPQVPAFTIDGTPADCVNIAIHHLCVPKPDLVVSGINAGLNAGACFMLSSGTVGACLEANVARIPAIALSQAFDRDTMNYYIAEYALPEPVQTHLEKQTERVLPNVLRQLLEHGLDPQVTWNVNFPFHVKEEVPVVTTLGDSTYGSCYRREENRFIFDLTHVSPDSDPASDAQQLRQGCISVTPLRSLGLGILTDKDKRLFT